MATPATMPRGNDRFPSGQLYLSRDGQLLVSAEALDGPEHAGLFESLADDGLAACLYDTGTDEQVLFAEQGVVHASGVVGKVVGRITDLLGEFRIG
jgi:hypothetical protein